MVTAAFSSGITHEESRGLWGPENGSQQEEDLGLHTCPVRPWVQFPGPANTNKRPDMFLVCVWHKAPPSRPPKPPK